MISRSFAPISDRFFFHFANVGEWRKSSPLRDVVFLLVGDRKKSNLSPNQSRGNCSAITSWLLRFEDWKTNAKVIWIKNTKVQDTWFNNLNDTVGVPHMFLPNEWTKWDFEISWFQVFTLPIYSFTGHLNQILATSFSKGKRLVRTKVFRDHVTFGETKGGRIIHTPAGGFNPSAQLKT